jgi:hypothetical protein
VLYRHYYDRPQKSSVRKGSRGRDQFVVNGEQRFDEEEEEEEEEEEDQLYDEELEAQILREQQADQEPEVEMDGDEDGMLDEVRVCIPAQSAF